MTECDEIAETLTAPRGSSLDECRVIVRAAMDPGEGMTVIDNVDEALWIRVNNLFDNRTRRLL